MFKWNVLWKLGSVSTAVKTVVHHWARCVLLFYLLLPERCPVRGFSLGRKQGLGVDFSKSSKV